MLVTELGSGIACTAIRRLLCARVPDKSVTKQTPRSRDDCRCKIRRAKVECLRKVGFPRLFRAGCQVCRSGKGRNSSPPGSCARAPPPRTIQVGRKYSPNLFEFFMSHSNVAKILEMSFHSNGSGPFFGVNCNLKFALIICEQEYCTSQVVDDLLYGLCRKDSQLLRPVARSPGRSIIANSECSRPACGVI
ncbi:hypothetical protein CDAR_294931 [Caerostris darwini]|uniref:Uncharacterized protein n=1 Tax=Caerostris darwini TaxID=1538125 RepID=A0AAV4UKN4_9ARAC|nr:hypothetical protein CDAR_294931 [Caerostris darwini]